MTLWVAYNGFLGYGPVGAIVEAPDEATARQLASEALRANVGLEDVEEYSVVRDIRELVLPYVGDTL
jgi:hypothetical protein